MARQHHPVIGIGGGKGEHRLVRCADPVERFADCLQMDLSATQETVEIEHDRLDPVVARRRVERADQFARLEFACGDGLRQQRREGIDLGPLFDDHAVEIEDQRAFAHLGRARPRGQHREQQREEQQHEEQHQPILQANHQAPDAAREFHNRSLWTKWPLPRRSKRKRHAIVLERAMELD